MFSTSSRKKTDENLIHLVQKEVLTMEPMSAVFMTFGVILIVAGWVQLLITSFGEDFSWGLTTLFLPPFSYIYSCFAFEKAKGALTLTGIGWVLVLLSL